MPATTMKLHEALAKSLADHGVTTLFGLIGDANLYMVDSYVRDHGGQYVSTSHEVGATLMALGYAIASEKVGVATVTHGAALCNVVTALVEGVRGQTPLVLLCGDTPIEDRENLQDVPQRDIVLATGAGFEQMRSPKTALLDMATAFQRAWNERRPVVLNMPVQFQWADVDYAPVVRRRIETRGLVADNVDMENAVGILAAARRPLILAGRGARGPAARAELVKLAERIGAPLATTLKAKDLFRDEAFNLGIFGTLSRPAAVDVINQADCIVAFGASLGKYTSSHGVFLKGKRLIQCNDTLSEIGKSVAPDAGLVGDPSAVAARLLHWLDEADIPASGFRSDEIRQALAATPAEDSGVDLSTATTVDLHKTITRLNDALPPARNLVTDGGRFVGEPWKHIQVQDPHHFVCPLHIGSIGLGLSSAIGAACAHPDRPTLLVTGDGGFMLGGLAELNTAVRHKLDLIIVMCNDSSYGAEHIQFRRKNMDPGLSLFDWPDFAPVARALGAEGVTVRSEADLADAITAMHARRGPILIDLKLDPDHMPAFP